MKKEIQLKLDLNSSFTIKEIYLPNPSSVVMEKITLIQNTAASRYGTITYFKVTNL
jgi:hypothetical protein